MTATFYIGDVLDVLGKLPEKSVDLVLTSPPFLALRSYLPADHPDKEKEGGSQSTPGEYIDWLLDVVEACDRVLAPHGSLCFELGDTYAGSTASGGDWTKGKNEFRGGLRGLYEPPKRDISEGWPLPKSLSLIPESFRFAMVYGFNPFTGRQTERWRLRNVKTWCRPNPPVGALGDKIRPATSDLMIFCKSPRRFFDLDAVRQAPSSNTHSRSKTDRFDLPSQERDGNWSTLAQNDYANPAGAPPLDWVELDYSPDYIVLPPGGYEGAHYAVWPAALLIEPIKSMCPEQVCRTCGEARRRIVEQTDEAYAAVMVEKQRQRRPSSEVGLTGITKNNTAASLIAHGVVKPSWSTLGFTDCGHSDYRPGVVLDCFGGSGTTAAVATGHGRDCVLIDLDERNFDLALERVGPLVLQRGEVAA